MDASKNENSFDNRRAALVSRGRGAPRAKIGRKSFAFNALGLTRARRTARGAQVARRARFKTLREMAPVEPNPLTLCAALQATQNGIERKNI